MMILWVVLWTLIATTWIAGTTIMGIKCAYHMKEADKCERKRNYGDNDAEEMHQRQVEHYKMAILTAVIAVALPVSAIVTLIVWLVS